MSLGVEGMEMDGMLRLVGEETVGDAALDCFLTTGAVEPLSVHEERQGSEGVHRGALTALESPPAGAEETGLVMYLCGPRSLGRFDDGLWVLLFGSGDTPLLEVLLPFLG